MKKKVIFILIFVIALIIVLNEFGFLNFLKKHVPVETETVSMSYEDFKVMCTDTAGEFNEGIMWGIGPVPYVTCGYEKARDARRVCDSGKLLDSCAFCEYGVIPGEPNTADSFVGPNSTCIPYKAVTSLSYKDIPENFLNGGL